MKFHMRYKHFSKDERLYLAILLKRGCSLREIAGVLGRNPSSVSREIVRNNTNGIYDPDKADHKAYVKRYNSKYQGMKIRENPWLEQYIQEKLKMCWAPEQITGRLGKRYGKPVISFKTIYKYLYSTHGQQLCRYLTSRRYSRVRRKVGKQKIKMFKNRLFIDKRPASINKRLRYGDTEGDVLGAPRTSRETLAGLVDRKSRYFLAQKIRRLAYAMDCFKELSAPLSVRSYTFDNGVENARYLELGLPVYFCHTYSAWEKGTIENTFQRLRRFIPKKKRIDDYSEEQISAIVDAMNNTPRKCLDYRTPQELFDRYQRKPINQGVALEG